MAARSNIDPGNLVHRIASGDQSAEAELATFFFNSLRFILRSRYRDPQFVEDVLQQTFIAVIENLRAGKLRDPAALAGYIRTIALNTANEWLRKDRKVAASAPAELDRRASEDDVLAALETHELAALVRVVIEDLKQPRDRELILRYYYQDADKAQLCEQFAITPEHFDRVRYRACERLKALIRKRTRRTVEISAVATSLVALAYGKENTDD